MADPIRIEKYGRVFEFPDAADSAAQERRIANWMKQHAPDELDLSDTGASDDRGLSFKTVMPKVMAAALTATPLGAIARTPGAERRFGDKNFYRTIAQGVLPYADEGIAGIRALLGGNYDSSLEDERKGLKQYEDEYGIAESLGLQALGAASTIPLTMGAGAALQGTRAAPYITRASSVAARHPWKTAALGGAGVGAITGFGAGEGGLENRAENAAGMAAVGTVLGPAARGLLEGAQKAGNYLFADNAVSNYLRRRIGSELADPLRAYGARQLPNGEIDTADPMFRQHVERLMRSELRDQRQLSVDPMAADLLPKTTEAVLQKPGTETTGLARDLAKRQYNFEMAKDNPDLARQLSQSGRVSDAFGAMYGANTFKQDKEQALATLRANANAAYQNAYNRPDGTRILIPKNRLTGLLDSPAAQEAITEATELAANGNRSIGTATGFDMEFLHDVKRALDARVQAGTDTFGKMDKDAWQASKLATRLNNRLKNLNHNYAAANKQFSDDSKILEAFDVGRSILKDVDSGKGMSAREMKRYLSDPNTPQAVRDAFRIGGAQAIRNKVLEPTGKAFTHNWSDFINKPEIRDRLEALADLSTPAGRDAWELFRQQMSTEAKNFSQVASATQNSRTAPRQELVREMESVSPGEVISAAASPLSQTGIRAMANAAWDKVSRADQVANRTAKILRGTGSKGNRESVDRIRDLLRTGDEREALYDTLKTYAPLAPVLYPFNER